MSAPSNEFDLYSAIGEIRSDVKTLLANHTDLNKRVGWLEKKYWIAAGGAGVVGLFLPMAVARAFGFM